MLELSSPMRFEDRLNEDRQLALREGSLYFDRRGSVWETARRLSAVLNSLQIPYAVIGALGMFHHGYRRFTENINVLLAAGGLSDVISHLSGFERNGVQSRRFIDLATGVSVLFHIEGEAPGRMPWKQLRFPAPPEDADNDDGIRFVSLPLLISLKLASGLSNPARTRDIADVQEMIKELCLVKEMASSLHPDVQDKFESMCRDIDDGAGPFLLLWELPSGTQPTSIDDIAANSGERSAEVAAMQRDGIRLFEPRPFYENCAILTTDSRVLARKYDMHHESEHLFKE